MFKNLLLLPLLAFLWSPQAFAVAISLVDNENGANTTETSPEAEDNTQVVVARGMGKDANAATKDALAQAVMQVVGALVDAETLIANDELVKDEILTYSNGMVQSFEVVKPPTQNDLGIYETTIKAVVENKAVHDRLVSAKILQVKVEGMADVWAQLVTENQRTKDREAMLEKAIQTFLKQIEPQKLLKVDFIDFDGNLGNEAKPKVVKTEDGDVFFQIGVIGHLDLDAYFDLVTPFMAVLEKLCDSSSDFSFSTTATYLKPLADKKITSEMVSTSDKTPFRALHVNELSHFENYTIQIYTKKRVSLSQFAIRAFFFEEGLWRKVLKKFAFTYTSSKGFDDYQALCNHTCCKIHLVLSDKDGNEIASSSYALLPGSLPCREVASGGSGRGTAFFGDAYFLGDTQYHSYACQILIHPFFGGQTRNSLVQFELGHVFNIKLYPEDLKDIADMKVSIVTEE